VLSDIKQFILDHDHFLVAGHINADGDAISASLAIAKLLDVIGKKYRLIFDDQRLDQRFNFLDGYDQIESFQDSTKFDAKAAIICDTPTIERLGKPANLLPNYNQIVKIDHHPSDDHFAHYDLVDCNSSSTTCLVYQLLEEFNMDYSVELAQIIMTGLMYDTGRFSYQNTKAIDFEIAAKMMNYGAQPEISYKKTFSENSKQAFKTIGKGLAGMESYFNDQVGIIFLNLEDTNLNEPEEIEELASFTTGIRGCHIGYFIREVEPDVYKISCRSKGKVDVRAIAGVFGGGGHQKASGCHLTGTLKSVKDQLLNETKKHLVANGYTI